MWYIMSMKTIGKLVIVLMLFTGLAVYSFGETYYGLTGGFYRLMEEFPKENYGRTMNGSNAVFSFYYFPGESSLGFYTHVSAGNFTSGMEAKDDERPARVDVASAWDVRLCLAPSYKFQLGSRVRIPVSLGPVFTIYNEENYGYWSMDYPGVDTIYDSFTFGVLADGSLIVNPFKLFFIKSGISLGWDFARVEKGEMNMEYRKTRNARYNSVPYMALASSFYFGIGLRFE